MLKHGLGLSIGLKDSSYPTAISVGRTTGLSPLRVSPDHVPTSPLKGGRRYRLAARAQAFASYGWKEEHMRLIKRIAISVGSLLALAVAGGAHFKF